MTILRIVAIVAIFAVACAGWMVLGTATSLRSESLSERLCGHVETLWGSQLVQQAPSFLASKSAGAKTAGDPAAGALGDDLPEAVLPASSVVRVQLTLDYRRKGLIWYPTYVCAFAGTYVVTNERSTPERVRMHVDFPSKGSTYDDFTFAIDDASPMVPIDTAAGIDADAELAPGQSRILKVGYRTRGIGQWRYQPGTHGGRVHNLDLVVTTDFKDVDYPDGALSPMASHASGSGQVLSWSTSDLITTQDIGVIIPEKLNPGPVAARITYFAPVCLLFFFVLVAAITVVKRIDIHPMHYLFVAAGFFAFHLLLAYLVDVVDIHIAFLIATVSTVSLVTCYLSAALGRRFPVDAAIGGQLFFLVLFSYSFFLKGTTGLTVAIGSVLTLAVLMALTAKLDWNEVFVIRKLAGGRGSGRASIRDAVAVPTDRLPDPA